MIVRLAIAHSIRRWLLVVVLGTLVAAGNATAAGAADRLRLIIETDAGGDPDDEQSLVRFLLYVSEWDVEGIIANRPSTRPGENWNKEPTGLGVVRQLLNAYGACWTNLVRHDARFPTRDQLWARTVPGYNSTEEAVALLIAAVDKPDPRPIWYSDWGTDHGAATNNLQRALDRVLRERGPDGYAKFKSRLRLSSSDAFADHTARVDPPFSFWVDTWRPPMNGRRWYHQFSALTSRAGGFDLEGDVRTGHGPLGALYPTNTTHWCKEGDTASFLYLVPTGLSEPLEPGWGGWAGRYGANTNFAGKAYYWASQFDEWNGKTNRDNTLLRWAVHLQNDFRARLAWCVRDFAHANHPPAVRVKEGLRRTVKTGESVTLDAGESSDPDSQPLRFEWFHYREAGTFAGPQITFRDATAARVSFTAPPVEKPESIHIVAMVTDSGEPALTRYARVVVTVEPR